MDEAERCHPASPTSPTETFWQVAPLPRLFGRRELTTWAVTGPELFLLAEQLRQKSGVQQAVMFGTALHVSSADAAALDAAIAPFRTAPYEWTRIRSGLEDVFIHLMNESKDNFAS